MHIIIQFKSRKSTFNDLIGGKIDLFDFEMGFYYCYTSGHITKLA